MRNVFNGIGFNSEVKHVLAAGFQDIDWVLQGFNWIRFLVLNSDLDFVFGFSGYDLHKTKLNYRIKFFGHLNQGLIFHVILEPDIGF